MRRIALHPETGITFRKPQHSSMSTIVSSSPLPHKEPLRSSSTTGLNHIDAKRSSVPAPSILRHTRWPFRAYETST
nr:unnamed protein product [Haemonchus contortus]